MDITNTENCFTKTAFIRSELQTDDAIYTQHDYLSKEYLLLYL